MLNKYISVVLLFTLINNTSYSANSKIEINNSALDNGYYNNTIVHYKKQDSKYMELRSKNFPLKSEYIDNNKKKLQDSIVQLQYNYYFMFIQQYQLSNEYYYWENYLENNSTNNNSEYKKENIVNSFDIKNKTKKDNNNINNDNINNIIIEKVNSNKEDKKVTEPEVEKVSDTIEVETVNSFNSNYNKRNYNKYNRKYKYYKSYNNKFRYFDYYNNNKLRRYDKNNNTIAVEVDSLQKDSNITNNNNTKIENEYPYGLSNSVIKKYKKHLKIK